MITTYLKITVDNEVLAMKLQGTNKEYEIIKSGLEKQGCEVKGVTEVEYRRIVKEVGESNG